MEVARHFLDDDLKLIKGYVPLVPTELILNTMNVDSETGKREKRSQSLFLQKRKE
jgi:hypothetical protein